MPKADLVMEGAGVKVPAPPGGDRPSPATGSATSSHRSWKASA